MVKEVTTEGVTRLAAAFHAMDRQLEKDFYAELAVGGETVRDKAADLLWHIRGAGEGARNTAAKYRSRVRRSAAAIKFFGGITVVVDNPLRKVTGQHPDWGRTQMRDALEPALAEKRPEVEEALREAVFALPKRYGF